MYVDHHQKELGNFQNVLFIPICIAGVSNCFESSGLGIKIILVCFAGGENF